MTNTPPPGRNPFQSRGVPPDGWQRDLGQPHGEARGYGAPVGPAQRSNKIALILGGVIVVLILLISGGVWGVLNARSEDRANGSSAESVQGSTLSGRSVLTGDDCATVAGHRKGVVGTFRGNPFSSMTAKAIDLAYPDPLKIPRQTLVGAIQLNENDEDRAFVGLLPSSLMSSSQIEEAYQGYLKAVESNKYHNGSGWTIANLYFKFYEEVAPFRMQ